MKKLLCSAACAALLAGGAHAQLIYSNDFDGNEVTGLGITVTPTNVSQTGTALVGSWNAAGWAGTFLKNSSVSPITTTQYVFSGIGAHSTISLGGVLGLLDSWDSTNGSPAPDYLEVLIDGSVVAALTTNNASGSNIDLQGGTQLAYGEQVDSFIFYDDTLVDFTSSGWATFAHSSSTLTVGFRAAGSGWQGDTDEAWGLDNFSVTAGRSTTGAVPEPASWAMMIGGLGLVGVTMRRRRANVQFA